MKIALLFWLLIMLYGIYPIEPKALWIEKQADDLTISGQGCGCPCPNAFIRQGSLDIPEQMLHEHPGMHRQQLNLVGNTPFDPLVFEVAVSELLIEGQIVGIDTILCSQDGCEFAARFQVDDWTLLEYQPMYLSWSTGVQSAYQSFFYLGIFLMALWVVVRFTTLDMWLRLLDRIR